MTCRPVSELDTETRERERETVAMATIMATFHPVVCVKHNLDPASTSPLYGEQCVVVRLWVKGGPGRLLPSEEFEVLMTAT